MDITEHIDIYECLDRSGDPSHYICHGHVDSQRFREECFREYSIRPMVIQHRWQKTKREVIRDAKKKRARSRITSIQCRASEQDAKAITIGLVHQGKSEQELEEFDIN